MAFAACYFDIEGQYTDLSGLTIVAQVADQREIPVSLDFGTESRSFLFSSTLGRFSFQPSWSSMDNHVDGNTDLQTNLGWHGQTLPHENIRIGNEVFHEKEIELVVTQPVLHSQYQEVGGRFSFNRESYFMAPRRILRFSDSTSAAGDGKVKITSLGARKFPWPLTALSIPVSSPLVWSFPTTYVFLGDIRLVSYDVGVDPSLVDTLIPMSAWAMSLRHLPDFDIDPDSGRLYIVPNRVHEVHICLHAGADDGLDNRIRFIGKVRLLNKSLRFPDPYAAGNIRISPILGPMIPLRIRFVNTIHRIWIGKSLIDSYKHIYLDNIHSMIRLVPRTLAIATPSAVHPRSALLVEDVFTNAPSLQNALFPLTLSPISPTRLDRGLIPWSFRESVNPRDGLKSYHMRFARIYELSQITRSRTTFRLDHAHLLFSASLVHGVSLSSTLTLSDPRLYLVAEVSIGPREIAVRIVENGLLLDIPRPVPLGSKNDESVICSVCAEEIESGQLHQLLPLCKHMFHAPCIYPWFHHHKKSCPNCRSEIPLVHFVNA